MRGQRTFPKDLVKGHDNHHSQEGDTSDPQNFRPIALQPVVEKIFNSLARNKVWSFLTRNNLIDTSMQK